MGGSGNANVADVPIHSTEVVIMRRTFLACLILLLLGCANVASATDLSRYCCTGYEQTSGNEHLYCGWTDEPPETAPYAVAGKAMEYWTFGEGLEMQPLDPPQDCGVREIVFDVDSDGSDPADEGLDWDAADLGDAVTPSSGVYYPYVCTGKGPSMFFPSIKVTLHWTGYAQYAGEAQERAEKYWLEHSDILWVDSAETLCTLKITKLPPKGGGDPGD